MRSIRRHLSRWLLASMFAVLVVEAAVATAVVAGVLDQGESARVLPVLLIALAVTGVLFAAGFVFLVRRVVASGCRPLADLGERVDHIDPRALGVTDLILECPEELEPLRDGFFRFTRRIAELIEREKRVTSNIAHELRTPVAELLTIAELARRWPDDEALAKKTVAEAYGIALQMDRVLRTCLRLARLQAGEASLRTELVDVSELLGETCRRQTEVGNTRDLELKTAFPLGIGVQTDKELLELMLSNLVDNAFHHAPGGAWVRVRAASGPDYIRVCVENPASDLESSDLEHIGEPFWRKEESRSDWRHVGLGLAMVMSAARAVGGRLDFKVVDGRFQVDLYLPKRHLTERETATALQ